MEFSSHLLAVGYATRDGTHTLKYLDDFASFQVEYGEPSTSSDLEANLSRQKWAVILYDLAHPTFEARHIIESVRRLAHPIPVIGLVDSMSMEDAVDLIRLGFCGVVKKQDSQRLLEMVKQEIARQQTPVRPPDSEKRYHDIFKMGLPMLVIEPITGEILDANPAAQRFYGYDLDTFRTKTVYDFNLSSAKQIRERLEQPLTDEMKTYYFIHRHADGSLRHVEIFSTTMDFNGAPKIYSIVTDISARMTAQKALEDMNALLNLRVQERTFELERTRDRLEAIFEYSGDGILLVNVHAQIQQANYAFAQMFGHSAESVSGEIFTSYFDAEDALRVQTCIQEAATTHQAQRIEVCARHVDDRELAVEMHIAPVNRSPEAVHNLVCIIRDISERKRLEKELARKYAELDRFFSVSADMLDIANSDGVLLKVNGAWEKLLGLSVAQIEGKHFLDFVHPDDIPATLDAMTQLSQQNPVIAFVNRYRSADGSYRLIEWRSIPDGNLIYASARDITERKQLEDALRQSEKEYRLIAENTSDGIVIIDDATRRILYVSPVYDRMHGRAEGYSQGLDAPTRWALIHPDDRESVIGQIEDTIAHHRSYLALTYRVQHRDGHYIWREDHAHYLYAPDGTYLKTYLVARDITERKQIEEALQQSEERYRLLTESTKDMILRLASDGRRTYVSPAAYALTGYTPQELMAEPRIMITHSDEYRAGAEAFQKAMVSGANYFQIEQRIRHKDGHDLWASLSFTLVRDPQTGALVEIIGIIQDISERKQAQEALQQALEKERQLNLMKTRFVSTASHEFRTPLAIILSSTETLLNYRAKMDEQQVTTRLNRIAQQVLFMKGIMEDVLQLARIQTGRFDFRPTKGDLNALCQEIIEDFATQPEHQGRVRARINPTPVMLDFDNRLMRHVVNNLLSNALKYSPAEKPVYIDLIAESNQVTMTIRDEGIGIPPDDLERLFEPFHRAKNAGSVEGTGLGLSIAQEAVELHGGSIKAESTEGVGTTFTVTLPL